MPLDQKFIGTVFEPFTFEVDKSKIRELAQALGDENPIFVDDKAAQAAGLPGIVAPPTFPTLFKMWSEGGSLAAIKAMGGDPLRLLHGEEAYEYHAFIRPGDVITGQTTVVDIEEKRGRSSPLSIVKLQTDYRNRQDDLVVVAHTTLIIRG